MLFRFTKRLHEHGNQYHHTDSSQSRYQHYSQVNPAATCDVRSTASTKIAQQPIVA